MTNLKKIGLTALAGTLAATTFAQAGATPIVPDETSGLVIVLG
jgi:hypothetical protein